jgi:hypothetical protein
VCIVAASSVGVATSATKAPAQRPLELTVLPGCWASVVNFRAGCAYGGSARVESLADFNVTERLMGDAHPIAVRYIDLFTVAQPGLGSTEIGDDTSSGVPNPSNHPPGHSSARPGSGRLVKSLGIAVEDRPIRAS